MTRLSVNLNKVALIRNQRDTARMARGTGMGMNAGHDLNLRNLDDLISAIPDLDEVSIGHALTVDALNLGLFEATKAYLTQLRRPQAGH